MRFKDVFSIIGPSMIGPSSSHTAGAVRIGRAARALAGGTPERADITFHGSFAETYKGHGTDLAVTAGLLGLKPDDDRIPSSLEIADSLGLPIRFIASSLVEAHPNTAVLALESAGRTVRITGISIGGGNIEIIQLDGFDVKFTCDYPTVVIEHHDRPGLIAEVTALLDRTGANIARMQSSRLGRGGEAMTVIETDMPPEEALLGEASDLIGVRRLRTVLPESRKPI